MSIVERRKPMCLKCDCLVWSGFHANCVNILMPESTFTEAIEEAEAHIKHGEVYSKMLRERHDREFEKSVESMLMATPYIVWRRKGVIRYYEHAPKTRSECPYGGPYPTNLAMPH